MKQGVIVGITRDGLKPVVIGEAGPLPQVRAELKAMRTSADGDRFAKIQCWTNRNVVGEVKLKPSKAVKAAPEKEKPAPKKKVSKKEAATPADE